MAEIYDIGSYGITVTMKAKEGNLTMTATQGVGGEVIRPSLAAPIVKGDAVKLADDMTVEKCAAGDSPIGFAVADPENWINEPTANAADGAYERRTVSIQLLGRTIKTVPLEAANTKVSVGDKIKVGATTYGCYDKGTATNNSVALEAAAASSGKSIAVLFGAYTI